MKLKTIIYLATLSHLTLATNALEIQNITCPASVADVVHVLKDNSFHGLKPCGRELNRSCYNASSLRKLEDYNRADREEKLSAVYLRSNLHGQLLTCVYELREPLYFHVKILPEGACELKENESRVDVCAPENFDTCHLACSMPLTLG